MAKKAAPEKKKKKTLSPVEKAQALAKRQHINAVRKILTTAGFKRLSGISDKDFKFKDRTSDFDDMFLIDNVILFAEYTTSKNAGEHLKNKKIIYDLIMQNYGEFIEFLKKTFPTLSDQIGSHYHNSKIICKILYCYRFDLDEDHKSVVPGPVYFNYQQVQYFLYVTDAIKHSARFELLHFMGIPLEKVGSIKVSEQSREFRGSILPEAHSNFDDGYKVVSFYADAEILLRTSYVMRKDGWRDSTNLYQRMISKAKIEGIRSYLKKQRRVFINNIIVTLPPDVQTLDENKKTIDFSTLTETAPVIIKIPERANSIGIIDGQHRIFAYHETVLDDENIARLRSQQNLLVTGIVYPENIIIHEREKFEARLFLEINSNQTTAKAPLKQAIGMVIDPFSIDSISTKIMTGLSKQGPLSGWVQQYFWDKDLLKTASIVSYGLKPLAKMSGEDSLFYLWNHPDKEKVASGRDDALLAEYISFCVTTINIVLGSIRSNLAGERWDSNKKVPGRVISTTYINSFLILTRFLISAKLPIDFKEIKSKTKEINSFEFSKYKSSQYGKMATEMANVYFGITTTLPTPVAPLKKSRKVPKK